MDRTHDTPSLTALFEEATGLVLVTYRGVLTPEVTARFYQWLAELDKAVGIKAVRGAIFDFRQVTEFARSNISAIHQESFNANLQLDMSHVPVALLVATPRQEQHVQSSMQVTPQQKRKRIVKSEEAGLTFIHEWNKAPSKA